MSFYYISKSKFNKLEGLQHKITSQEWIDAINSRSDFTWFENTDLGVNYYNARPNHPLNVMAVSNYSLKNNQYGVTYSYTDEYGLITVTSNKMTTEKFSLMSYLADKIGAIITTNGRKIIDKTHFEKKI